MEAEKPENTGGKTFSKEMLSVLLILSADFYLHQSTRPYINYADRTINWPALFKLPLNDSHKAALTWAYCIEKNELPNGYNPFVLASAMSPEVKKVVLEALTRCWNFSK